MSKPLHIVLAAVVLFGLGSGFGTALHRASRLPAWFWLPCVSGAACLVAYVLFFVFLLDAHVGRIACFTAWGISAGWFAFACRDAHVRQTLRRRDAWLPVLLTALLTASYLGSVLAIDTPVNTRFRYPLPGDNLLPRQFAEWVASGSFQPGVAPPMFEGGWRTSDRPPLQAGLALIAMTLRLGGDPVRMYDFAATLCQMGWLAALYALARTIALPRRYLQFALAAAASSPFFFFNSVYTWPKLLATWLFITGLAIGLQVLRDRRTSAWALVMASGAIALSLLSHGGVAFSLLALPLLVFWWKPWTIVRTRPWALIASVLILPVLYAPWSMYQTMVDPPGNRLIKQHFAGVEEIDPRGTLEAIADTYRTLDVQTYVAGRWVNVTQQWFGTYELPFESWIDWVQWQQMMRHVPLIGFLCVGYIMLLRTPARADLPGPALQLVRQLTWYAIATAAIWIVVMIVPGSAMLHQGSYAMTLLLLFGAAVLTAMLPAPIRWTVLTLHVALFATCYLFSVRTSVPTPVAWRPWTLVEAGAIFAGFLLMLAAVPDSPPRGSEVTASSSQPS